MDGQTGDWHRKESGDKSLMTVCGKGLRPFHVDGESSTSISGAIFLVHKVTVLPHYYGFEAQPRDLVNLPLILHNRTLTTFEPNNSFPLVDMVRVLYNILC